jgi:hypothetical protein
MRRQLEADVARYGKVFLRDLAAAETAVLRGQFNLAKVLRALAHTQRVLGMNAARLLAVEKHPRLSWTRFWPSSRTPYPQHPPQPSLRRSRSVSG